jgi:hypothetical protein
MLTRDTDLWEKLFSQPIGNDKWGSESLETMLDTVSPGSAGTSNHEQAIQAEHNAGKRKDLFGQYMEKLCGPELKLQKPDFLGHGDDAGGKADFQGCSEFNPVRIFSDAEQKKFDQAKDKSDRNAENAPNRRVMVLIFRKGSRVNPNKWPCPRANEGVAGCKKRFWSDGEKRRSSRLPSERRLFEKTKDTFACRFYQRLTDKSPCEKVLPPPTPPTLEFVFDSNDNLKVENSDAVTPFARMGLWDHAFDPTAAATAQGSLLNKQEEKDNFVGADTRRFYLRVTDKSRNGTVSVDWRTLNEDGTNLDRPADQSITLVETAPGSGIFASRALMLVSDLIDRQAETDSGVTTGPDANKKRKVDESNHRIRRGSMTGFVEAEYQPLARPSVTAKINVFNRSPDERRRLPVQIFVLRVAAGGAGNIATAPGSDIFGIDIRVMKEIYERLGIKLATVVHPSTPAGNIKKFGPDSIVEIDPPASVANPNNVTFADEEALAKANPAVDNDTLRVFFVRRLASGNGGEAWPDVDFATLARHGCAFTIQATGPYAATHEMGHILSNKSNAAGAVVPGHYAPPAAPAGNRLRNFQNLMKREFLGPESVLAPKRLWDAADADSVNQFTAIRASHYTRNF